MRILFAADIHASPNHLNALMDTALSSHAEGLIIGGDIVPHYLPQYKHLSLIMAQATYLRETFIPAFKDLKARRCIPVFLDMGNDDLAANRSILEAYDGGLFHLLHMRRWRLAKGVDIIGYMAVPPTPFNRKDWEKPDTSAFPGRPGNQFRTRGFITKMGREEKFILNLKSPETIEADLKILSRRIRRPFIFISHSPPADTPLDLTDFNRHVGSLAIHDFISQWARAGLLVASLHGHIHESPAISGANKTRINGAICINPGQNNGLRAQLKYVLIDVATSQNPPIVHLLEEPDNSSIRRRGLKEFHWPLPPAS